MTKTDDAWRTLPIASGGVVDGTNKPTNTQQRCRARARRKEESVVEKHKMEAEMPQRNDPAVEKAVVKKPYIAPVLVEYGTIAKLTQGTRTRNNDGKNSRRRRRCI